MGIGTTNSLYIDFDAVFEKLQREPQRYEDWEGIPIPTRGESSEIKSSMPEASDKGVIDSVSTVKESSKPATRPVQQSSTIDPSDDSNSGNTIFIKFNREKWTDPKCNLVRLGHKPRVKPNRDSDNKTEYIDDKIPRYYVLPYEDPTDEQCYSFLYGSKEADLLKAKETTIRRPEVIPQVQEGSEDDAAENDESESGKQDNDEGESESDKQDDNDDELKKETDLEVEETPYVPQKAARKRASTPVIHHGTKRTKINPYHSM